VRIFDFGTDTTSNMFLTPDNGSGTIRFAITTGGNSSEQQIDGTGSVSTGSWQHTAVTKSGTTGILYINGVEVGRNSNMTINPADLGNTVNNYIGRSQYSDPYLDGTMDDFLVYNRALSISEITSLAGNPPCVTAVIGDVSEDGSIDIVDALLVAQCYVGLQTCPDLSIADTNCDGTIDIVDAFLIAQYYVGLINGFC